MSGIWQSVATEYLNKGFMYGFSSSFAESFNKAFLEDFDLSLIQNHTQAVFCLYSETFTNIFTQELTQDGNADFLTTFSASDIEKITNAAVKNGQVMLLRLLIKEGILSEEQSRKLICNGMINGIVIEDLQETDVLSKALLTAGIISSMEADWFQQSNQRE